MVVINHQDLRNFNNEWFSCKRMWCNYYRLFYHKRLIQRIFQSHGTSSVHMFTLCCEFLFYDFAATFCYIASSSTCEIIQINWLVLFSKLWEDLTIDEQQNHWKRV